MFVRNIIWTANFMWLRFLATKSPFRPIFIKTLFNKQNGRPARQIFFTAHLYGLKRTPKRIKLLNSKNLNKLTFSLFLTTLYTVQEFNALDYSLKHDESMKLTMPDTTNYIF